MIKCTGLIAAFLLLIATASAQSHDADVKTAFVRAQHLRHGINASIWFAQHPEDYSAKWTDHFTDASDIALIEKLGFDNVRISIDPTPLEQSPRNAEGLNADFISRLDKAVDTMIAHHLAVQIDIHPEEEYKRGIRTSDDAVERFIMLWRKLATHYANRDSEMVFFEVMNEPEVSDRYRWAGIQARAATVIRNSAPKNTIIATGPNYSDATDLMVMEPLSDGNVIYNFHFYNPHQFTHQGASWGEPWWIYTHNIPYPAEESTMQQALKQVPDAGTRFKLESYFLDHWDAHRIQLSIDAVAAWGHERNIPLICNEFGVYGKYSDLHSRAAWIHDMRSAMEKDGIGWAMWDYRTEFGVVQKEEGKAAKPDPAIVEALGLKK